ncbi:hypothetical protein E4U54_006458 [Claviceps lovelessii]|nr:hypothetical protein E4U54_006458 [Claviceps lovelessii]
MGVLSATSILTSPTVDFNNCCLSEDHNVQMSFSAAPHAPTSRPYNYYQDNQFQPYALVSPNLEPTPPRWFHEASDDPAPPFRQPYVAQGPFIAPAGHPVALASPCTCSDCCAPPSTRRLSSDSSAKTSYGPPPSAPIKEEAKSPTSSPRIPPRKRQERDATEKKVGKKPSRPRKPSRAAKTAIDGETDPPEPLQLKSDCPELERFIFRLLGEYQINRGRDMWEKVQKEVVLEHGKRFRKEALQMKIRRARPKYIQWQYRDEQILREAFMELKNRSPAELLNLFLDKNGSTNMSLNVIDIQKKCEEPEFVAWRKMHGLMPLVGGQPRGKGRARSGAGR